MCKTTLFLLKHSIFMGLDEIDGNAPSQELQLQNLPLPLTASQPKVAFHLPFATPVMLQQY